MSHCPVVPWAGLMRAMHHKRWARPGGLRMPRDLTLVPAWGVRAPCAAGYWVSLYHFTLALSPLAIFLCLPSQTRRTLPSLSSACSLTAGKLPGKYQPCCTILCEAVIRQHLGRGGGWVAVGIQLPAASYVTAGA